MTAHIIAFTGDSFRPMGFTLTADKARSARADSEMAKTLKLWAQEAELIAQRGEMTPQRRLKLMEAIGATLDHPRVT